MNGASEFSCMIDRRQLKAQPVQLIADEAQRRALAKRFALISINKLEAQVELIADGDAVNAKGVLKAAIVQSCAVSGDDLPVKIAEMIAFRFVPARGEGKPDEEVELDEEDLDEIAYSGEQFDLGEAIAQSLALAIDPYAEGPNAEQARKTTGLLGEDAAGPFAALAALKEK